jgi:arylsulfatase A-like enzyme
VNATARGAFALGWVAWVGLAAGGVHGCGHKTVADGVSVDASSAASSSTSPGGLEPSPRSTKNVALDAVSGFDTCTLGYRGTVLDLGDATSRARFGSKLETPHVETLEREGATWARIRARSLSLGYYASADEAAGGTESGVYVETRIRGLAARTVTLYLDGKALGVAQLPKGEAAVVTLKGSGPPPGEGQHDVLLRFGGAPRATTDPLAEVDWVHIGSGEPEAHYAAPTRADVLTNTTIHGEPMQALSLRAPGFARCTGWIPKGAFVEASIAMSSGSQGDAQIRLLRDRADPFVLGSVHFSPSDPEPKRVSWSVGDLGGETGALAAIELVSHAATKGARVVFGAPRVVVPPGVASTAGAGRIARVPARGVVVVVLGELSTRSLSLYGGTRPVPELASLSRSGITFDGQRATSGLASGAFASLLTGQSARAHTLEDPSARLPHSIITIADAARQAGIATSLFTANPTTGAAFGFDRGWSTFEAAAPNEDAPAVGVFDRAGQWIDLHKAERFLVVVHARGGHPPWDATPDQLKTLEPQGYTGGLDAKHAAELLSRARTVPGSLHWTDADRERAWALYALAVDAHDAALGRLVQALHAAGRDGDTAIFVTGDVAVNEASHIPFADAETLDEPSLWTPLVVHLPDATLAGVRVTAPTSGLDVGRTVLATLGLEPPTSFGGIDLLAVAHGDSPAAGRPLVATAGGRFAVRWDRYVLSGARDREAKLCDLALEPACVTDVRPTYPLALEVLHRAAFDGLVAADPPPLREPATLDAPTAAALRAWGR